MCSWGKIEDPWLKATTDSRD